VFLLRLPIWISWTCYNHRRIRKFTHNVNKARLEHFLRHLTAVKLSSSSHKSRGVVFTPSASDWLPWEITSNSSVTAAKYCQNNMKKLRPSCLIFLSHAETLCGPGRVVGMATGYGLDGPRIHSRWGGGWFSAPVQTGSGAHPNSCMGTASFPGVKSGRGVSLTPHPLLVPWSWKIIAIPLFPLWAVRPVQSLSACRRVHFTLRRHYFIWQLSSHFIHNVSRDSMQLSAPYVISFESMFSIQLQRVYKHNEGNNKRDSCINFYVRDCLYTQHFTVIFRFFFSS
jgi:hypothetical protein